MATQPLRASVGNFIADVIEDYWATLLLVLIFIGLLVVGFVFAPFVTWIVLGCIAVVGGIIGLGLLVLRAVEEWY